MPASSSSFPMSLVERRDKRASKKLQTDNEWYRMRCVCRISIWCVDVVCRISITPNRYACDWELNHDGAARWASAGLLFFSLYLERGLESAVGISGLSLFLFVQACGDEDWSSYKANKDIWKSTRHALCVSPHWRKRKTSVVDTSSNEIASYSQLLLACLILSSIHTPTNIDQRYGII